MNVQEKVSITSLLLYHLRIPIWQIRFSKIRICLISLVLICQGREVEIERKLTEHIQNFLLELGQGFAFVGRQVHLEVGGDDFYIDLLFYHLKLRCYVVIELKACDFEPGFISQLNMYQNVVNVFCVIRVIIRLSDCFWLKVKIRR